ncbi:ABC transporter permease [Undibacterium sp. SXout7W]|uniref:ABC transporter permease n=1 Tax=Undibacterium sp. SXout7W TaxID=3413049 RepID=UPI003BF36854
MNIDTLAWISLVISVLVAILRASTPIIFATLGGLISDLAGSINVALEGLMLVAAFFGVIVSIYAPGWFPGMAEWIYPWLGCLAGITAALLLTGLLAVFYLELNADLIVAGIAINILASGLTVFLLLTIVGDKGSTAGLNSHPLPSIHIPGLDAFPVLELLLNGEAHKGHHVLMIGALFSVFLISRFLYRTRYGTWIRAVGENREAALAAGIPVKRVQYVAFFLSGLLAALGGIYLSMGYLTLFQTEMTAGRGFLALAAIFLGARRPFGSFAAAILFGATTVLATRLGSFQLPTELVFMLPPAITILMLVMVGWRRSV